MSSLSVLLKNYDIYSEDGELMGQQFRTDTGRIDILAFSKDRKELLVVELKRGRASDAVVVKFNVT
jgi:restriction system protein